MATTVLDDLGAYLAAQGVGTVGATIFLGVGLPAAPAACLVLKEYGGRAPSFTLPATSGISTEYPRVQVIVRSTTYALARATAEAAYKAFAKVANQTLTSTRYLRVEPLQAPGTPILDENGRTVISFNVECEKVLS